MCIDSEVGVVNRPSRKGGSTVTIGLVVHAAGIYVY